MSVLLYPALGAALIGAGLAAFVARPHPLWKIIAVNIAGSGVFLLLLTLPAAPGDGPDPVPQAMVLTGIVVTLAGTALALALAVRLAALQQRPDPAHSGPDGAGAGDRATDAAPGSGTS